MKKTFLTLLWAGIVLALLAGISPKPFVKYLPWLSRKAESVTLFCLQYDGDCVESGCGKIVSCLPAQLHQTLQKVGNVQGASFSFEGSISTAEKIAQKLKTQNVTKITCGNITTLCGYSQLFSGGVNIDGKTVNVQIAYCNGIVTVGSPLILGSY